MKNLLSALVLSCVLLVLTNCAKNPVTGKSQFVTMSEAQEIAMGQEADPQIIAQYGLYPDSSLQQFFALKGQQMAAISHRPNIKYYFRIIDSDVLNAFAVPGGYVYFTRGIMAHFNDEAQMAGVLGHEIGHIAARHSVIQQRNAMLGQIGIIAGVVVAPQLGGFIDAASQGLGLLFLKFGRDDEKQADELGVEYSSKINYDAQEMANFFTTLQRQSQQSGAQEIPTYLSTHPDPGDRYVTVSQLAAQWKQKLNLTNPAVNRDNYLRRLEGVIFGEDPRQGFIENSVFYHPELKFQFSIPQGWATQNTPQRLQAAPKSGKALLMLMSAQGNTLQNAAANALKNYKMTAVENRNVVVNGNNALVLVADQAQQQGGSIRTLSYFIQYGSEIYHLIGISALNDFNSFYSTFQNSMESFRRLTDATKLNRQPERVHIKTVAQATTLDQVLRGYKVPEKRLEEMAIVNGMKLTDRLNAGMLVKVIY